MNITTNKEDKDMANNGQVQVMDFELNGVRYTGTSQNYFYKKVDGKQKRIPKAEYEQAFEEYIQTGADQASADEWDAEKEIEERKEKQAEADKVAEDAINKKSDMIIPKSALDANKKQSKPRKSKDIALESNGITLTAKQVDFLKKLPNIDGWDGIEQGVWTDMIAESIGWNAMSVGAMISTLREKNLVTVVVQKINGKKCKGMSFTELGMAVAKEMGLE